MATKPKPSDGHATAATRRRSDVTFRQIMGLIYEGQFAPGERLPAERELAARLHVSRPTLRDALNRLEARGFLDRRTGSGNYVRTAVPESVRTPIEEGIREKLVTLQQIIDVRKPLEIWAAREAARRRDKTQIAELREAVATMHRAGRRQDTASVEAYFEADIRFHLIVAQMTGNAVYLHLLHFLTDLIRKSLTISRELLDEGFTRANTDRHKAVSDSIARGDATGAGNGMAEHFAFVEKRVAT